VVQTSFVLPLRCLKRSIRLTLFPYRRSCAARSANISRRGRRSMTRRPITLMPGMGRSCSGYSFGTDNRFRCRKGCGARFVAARSAQPLDLQQRMLPALKAQLIKETPPWPITLSSTIVFRWAAETRSTGACRCTANAASQPGTRSTPHDYLRADHLIKLCDRQTK
jgi:hypothetical protein